MSKKRDIQYYENKLDRLHAEIINKQKEIVFILKVLAKLQNKKVFIGQSIYDVTIIDYYIADKLENIEHADSYLGYIANYGDGQYFDDNNRELEDEEVLVDL